MTVWASSPRSPSQRMPRPRCQDAGRSSLDESPTTKIVNPSWIAADQFRSVDGGEALEREAIDASWTLQNHLGPSDSRWLVRRSTSWTFAQVGT